MDHIADFIYLILVYERLDLLIHIVEIPLMELFYCWYYFALCAYFLELLCPS